jgi:hypothetical protein
MTKSKKTVTVAWTIDVAAILRAAAMIIFVLI